MSDDTTALKRAFDAVERSYDALQRAWDSGQADRRILHDLEDVAQEKSRIRREIMDRGGW